MQQRLPLWNPQTGPRVALVHDYLIQDGGGERVLQALQEIFPQAPTFTLFYDPERAHQDFIGKDIRTSKLATWPFIRGREEWTLPFMPMEIERFDLSSYDLVISSSISFSKGVIVPPGALHICYMHTPTRWLWEDRVSYIDELPQPRIIKRFLQPLLHRLRQWDRLAAERPDVIVTNSEISKKRIQRYYRREAQIIHPPVDLSSIPLSTHVGSYWITGGRLVAYKRFDLTVRAFTKLNMPLKVFGIGPELERLKKIAGPKIEFLGRVSDKEKIQLIEESIGFIHPQIEDFGITAVEAMAMGKPVIAYGKGGASETVIPGVTGVHLEAQSWEDIGDAVIRFDSSHYDPQAIRQHAERFSKERFIEQFSTMIYSLVKDSSYV
jgi:glycosyltransferase involved in cell wall biosynthesis